MKYLNRFFPAALLAATAILSSTLIAATPGTTQTKNAYALPKPFLNDEEEDIFILGKSFFRIPWVEAPSVTTARDGLGPLFNANTCTSCHPGNGAGQLFTESGRLHRSLVIRLSQPSRFEEKSKTEAFFPDPVYGAQLSINGTHGVPFEGTPKMRFAQKKITYPDGNSVELRMPLIDIDNLNYGELDSNTLIGTRFAPALIGLGEIETISDESILANEDIDDRDKDGISGKANRIWSPQTGRMEIGRYTWKANAATIKHQSASAMHNDMGLSSPLYPQENCTESQKACLEAPKGIRDPFDVTSQRLDAVAFYLRHLKTPKPPKDFEGRTIFQEIACNRCHIEAFTGRNGKTIRPYSDFLLHDMGEGLADGIRSWLAQGNEWRTAPLWGIGSRKVVNPKSSYLHDGRARTLEEAILWHEGEARKSKEAFMNLDANKRQSLITFLETL